LWGKFQSLMAIVGHDGLKAFAPQVEGEESDGLPIVLNDQDRFQRRIIYGDSTFLGGTGAIAPARRSAYLNGAGRQ